MSIEEFLIAEESQGSFFTRLFILTMTSQDEAQVLKTIERAKELSTSDWITVAAKLLKEEFESRSNKNWELDDHQPSSWERACIEAGTSFIMWDRVAETYDLFTPEVAKELSSGDSK